MKIKFAIDSNDITTAIPVEEVHWYVMERYRMTFLDYALSYLSDYCDPTPYDSMSDEETWSTLDEKIKGQIIFDCLPDFINDYFHIYELDTETKKIEYIN